MVGSQYQPNFIFTERFSDRNNGANFVSLAALVEISSHAVWKIPEHLNIGRGRKNLNSHQTISFKELTFGMFRVFETQL